RNGEGEGRALADLALDPDAPAVHLDELLGDAEPQPRAAELGGNRGIGLFELGEHRLQPVRRNPNTGVADTVAEKIAVEIRGDLDAPLARELQRVADEIHEALRDPPAVAMRNGNAVG